MNTYISLIKSEKSGLFEQNPVFFCSAKLIILLLLQRRDSVNATHREKYYKIGEVAEILHIPCSTLRFWEKKFTIIRPRRTEGYTRYYSLEDIEKIRMVWYLVKEKGLKLEAAEQQIRQNRRNVSKRHEVVERLKAMREELLKLEEAFASMQ